MPAHTATTQCSLHCCLQHHGVRDVGPGESSRPRVVGANDEREGDGSGGAGQPVEQEREGGWLLLNRNGDSAICKRGTNREEL